MTKKHFIALADAIKEHNQQGIPFLPSQLDTLASFCKLANSNFNRERWLDYIAGECGPNGGKLKDKS